MQRRSEIPKDKDFTRLIRARMLKTGASYSAARAQFLSEGTKKAPASPPPLPTDYQKVAGMSDAAVSKATGKTWPQWTAFLDSVDAATMEHPAIVDQLLANHERLLGSDGHCELRAVSGAS